MAELGRYAWRGSGKMQAKSTESSCRTIQGLYCECIHVHVRPRSRKVRLLIARLGGWSCLVIQAPLDV